jgi:hypothetical protein
MERNRREPKRAQQVSESLGFVNSSHEDDAALSNELIEKVDQVNILKMISM